MKNVKDEVFAALLTVSEHVSDAYPKEWAGNEPTIQFTEEDNSVFEGRRNIKLLALKKKAENGNRCNMTSKACEMRLRVINQISLT